MSQQAAPPTPRALGFDAKKLVLSVCNPERDGFVDQWLTSVSTAIRADEIMVGNRWPETALYYVVGSNLQGSAAAWFQSMETIAIDADRTYERLAMRLRQQYGTKLTEAGAVSLIMDRKKMPSETYQEFGMALRALAQGAAVQEQFFIEAFSKGLGDFTGSLVRNKNPVTLMDAIHHATQARGNDGKEDGSEKKVGEDDEQEEEPEEESSGTGYQYGVPPVYTAQRGHDRDEELEDLRRQLRQARKESARPKGKRKRSFVDQGDTGVQLKTEDKQDVRRCHACDETGHVVARCPLVLEIRAWKAKRGKME